MNKIFEIRNRHGKLHFERFLLYENESHEVLLHRIYEADKDQHLHNHSWWFRATILSGAYEELRTNGAIIRSPRSVYEMSTNEYHKINSVIDGPIESLVLRAKTDANTWGYLVNGKHVHHKEYRQRK